MNIEIIIQCSSMFIALIAMIIKWNGMKEYIPVGMFASLYANVWCYIAMPLNWWHFPHKIAPTVRDIPIPANMVVIPILVMFWVRYMPRTKIDKIKWAFIWASILTGIEILIERYTQLYAYHGYYNWYFSFLLWLFSFFVFYKFHFWFYNNDNTKI